VGQGAELCGTGRISSSSPPWQIIAKPWASLQVHQLRSARVARPIHESKVSLFRAAQILRDPWLHGIPDDLHKPYLTCRNQELGNLADLNFRGPGP
jgi:hypothetical protein